MPAEDGESYQKYQAGDLHRQRKLRVERPNVSPDYSQKSHGGVYRSEEISPRRWLILAQGWSAATTLGVNPKTLQSLKGV
jgi:hypothetical protein